MKIIKKALEAVLFVIGFLFSSIVWIGLYLYCKATERDHE